jgi:hypothetical protein
MKKTDCAKGRRGYGSRNSERNPLKSSLRTSLSMEQIIEMLGSPVTPPALGAGELVGSNPAISTKEPQ